MVLALDWREIALRIGLAAAIGAVFGLNRSERGHAAGLRTTMLVCIAAALAMVQANMIAAGTQGQWNPVFRLDVMRLPLGILSGIGFIGAGAIIRRGELVRGLTTAATLWIVTVIGLCFGGGQLALGLGGAALGYAVLSILGWAEAFIHPERNGSLSLSAGFEGPDDDAVRAMLREAGLRLRSTSVTHEPAERKRHMQYDVKYRERPGQDPARTLAAALAETPHVRSVQWRCSEG